ncbi:hypothetical protein C4D27_17340 [Clostridium perfringens]
MKKIIDIKAFCSKDNIDLNYQDAINFLNENNLILYINKSYMMQSLNSSINFYIVDSKYSSKTLLFSIDTNKNIVFSNIAKESTNHENIKNLIKVFECVISYIMFISDGINLNNPKSNKYFKCIKSKDASVKVKDKSNNIEFKLISLLENETYKIIKENSAFKIINNDFSQNLIVVPSKFYPLANKNNIKIFDKNNTEALKENFNNILSKVDIRHGFCLENSRDIYNTLKPILGDRVKYYSGWLKKRTSTAFHAWVVIDDNSIIDSTILYKVEELERMCRSSELRGEPFIDDNEYLDILKKAINQSIAFNEKYRYGKVSELDIYIGVESNYEESYNCYEKLLANASNHPDLNNLDCLGRNNTLKKLGCY